MIYLIITTCIYNKWGVNDYEQRKSNYLDSINQTLYYIPKEMEIKVIIVENNGLENSYLDEFKERGCEVCYTSNNSMMNVHKGINELNDIKFVISKYNIQDDDIIIKITGRYHVLNDSFFKRVFYWSNDFDVFIKFYNVCTLEFMEYDCVLGLFAIKCKFLKNFNYNNNITSAEVNFATYIRENINKDKIYDIEYLNLRCCFGINLNVLDV